MVTKLYNKRLKHALPLVVILLCFLVTFHNYFLTDLSQATLELNALMLHKYTTFNPKLTTYHVIDHLEHRQSALGGPEGIWFHWDDWLDTSPADSILQPYRDMDFDTCDPSLEEFASVNGYWLESYNRKVMRGMSNLYCLKDIPEQVILNANGNYYQVPVAGKKRLGQALDGGVSSFVTSDLLSDKARNISAAQVSFSVKPFNQSIDINVDDFYFDPDYELLKLSQMKRTAAGLSHQQHKYLQFLKFSTDYVETSNRYFQYPWIISDVIKGNSHHMAYPFFKRFISVRERQAVIQHMIRAWFQFTEAIDVPSWVNYGSLLGWAYNGVNMPWDTDVDVQLPIRFLDYLGQHYNKSLIIEDPQYGNAKYFFEVSPTYIKQGNGKNFIDARFIDINSGLYIDISALSHSNFKPPKQWDDDQEIMVNCKNFNWHPLSEILPIRHTFFEGASVYIPNNISSILTRKYGKDSYTTKLEFHNYNYQSDIHLWVSDDICREAPETTRFKSNHKDQLTIDGACGSIALQDEYQINYQNILTHLKLNQDIDQPIDYDLAKIEPLKITRKDPWDYYHDINSGAVRNARWFHEYPV